VRAAAARESQRTTEPLDGAGVSVSSMTGVWETAGIEDDGGRPGHADVTDSRHARHRSADDIKRHPRTVYHPPVTSGMDARLRFAYGITAMACIGGRILSAQALDRRQQERIEQTLRQEGQAVVALADASAEAPADFTLTWHNDFLKAQTGTFVPFIVTIAPRATRASAALLYVRAARDAGRAPPSARGRRRTGPASLRGGLSGRAVRSAGSDRARLFAAGGRLRAHRRGPGA
jgi:hypothetical protein